MIEYITIFNIICSLVNALKSVENVKSEILHWEFQIKILLVTTLIYLSGLVFDQKLVYAPVKLDISLPCRQDLEHANCLPYKKKWVSWVWQ